MPAASEGAIVDVRVTDEELICEIRDGGHKYLLGEGQPRKRVSPEAQRNHSHLCAVISRPPTVLTLPVACLFLFRLLLNGRPLRVFLRHEGFDGLG